MVGNDFYTVGVWSGFSHLATCKTAALNNTLLKSGVGKSRNDLEWGLQVHVLKVSLFAAYEGKYSFGSVNILLAGPVKGISQAVPPWWLEIDATNIN